MNWFDNYFFGILHGLAGKSAPGDFLIIFFGDYFLYVCLIIFVYFAWRNRQQQPKLYGLAIVSALIARFGVAEGIRLFYHRLRPFLALHTTHLLSDYAYSFPSGHTIFMFALAAYTFYFNKKLSYFLLASGLVIGLARVAGGVHYPTDIFGGIVFGILTSLAVRAIVKLTNLGPIGYSSGFRRA
jgi:undecaprenyl-diphosphatase